MATQQIVDPASIEPELIRMWEELAKENKTRACLFNLIVFNELNSRTDYFRDIVQKVLEKYPCRVLFISSDPGSTHSYLKTAVSVVALQKNQGSVACDYIDIGVSGPDLERVPFVLLPHIIPDLPVSLLWTENLNKDHPLFTPLSLLANRVIFDSESADDLLGFAEKLHSIHPEKKKNRLDVADLNWARTENWRNLIASTFHSIERFEILREIEEIQITYNEKSTEFFSHLKIQALYLLAWFSSRLKGRKLDEQKKMRIQSEKWEHLGPGSIISIELKTKDGYSFQARRHPIHHTQVTIQMSSTLKCDLPYQFVMGPAAQGQSLVKEIITQGTSSHYIEMLNALIAL